MKLRAFEFRQVLSKREITIPMLAKMSNLQEETIYAAIRNPHRTSNWDTAYRIARALNMPMESLFFMNEYVRIEDSIEKAVKA